MKFQRKANNHYALRLLCSLLLILTFATSGFNQTLESDKTSPVIVSEQAMEQVVKRVLIWSFKPGSQPTIIYLSEERIKRSWLPSIKNIEFRLLSNEEIQEKELKVHFFTEPSFAKKTYEIGFAFGKPHCDYLGGNWHFRILKQRLRLWLNGGVGGGCDSVEDSF